MYKNWKIKASELDEKQEEYSVVAEWCNNSGQYHIEEVGEYFQVVENTPPTSEELARQEIQQLKQQLVNTDYVVIKIAEGSATEEEYADVIAQRRDWRARIDELEQLLKQ